MKYLSFLFCVCFFAVTVPGQMTWEIREKIMPLRSNRSDVEKLTGQKMADYRFVHYETEYGNVDIVFAKEKCTGHGWNVEPGTVLSYSFVPKYKLSLGDIPENFSRWIKTVDDAFYTYYTSIDAGITYVFHQDRELAHISFTARKNDSDLRCKGFPSYSPLPYEIYDSFTVRDIDRWDIGLLGGVIFRVKEANYLKGYIFIYCRKGEKLKTKELQKKIENMAYEHLRADRQQVIIAFGGYRDQTEIEAILIEKDNPPPEPTPTYGQEQILEKPKDCKAKSTTRGKFKTLFVGLSGGPSFQVFIKVERKNQTDENFVAITKLFKAKYCKEEKMYVAMFDSKQHFELNGIPQPEQPIEGTPRALYFLNRSAKRGIVGNL